MAAVVHRRAPVAELHRTEPFAGRTVSEPEVWWCDFSDAAMVLGSRQTDDVLDLVACARAGLAVVRRRSGGGAVLLRPDAVVWVDVVLPHGIAPDDVRRSMEWIGERWRDAIEPDVPTGVGLSVHAGAVLSSPWSDHVCFAGIGPGEVLAGGRKLVGLSQRRTRDGIRIQGMVHRRTVVDEMPHLFTGTVPTAPLLMPATLAGVTGAVLATRLADRLEHR
jgi:lipoate-protein ligase A